MLNELSKTLGSVKERILLKPRLLPTLILGIIQWGNITPLYGVVGSPSLGDMNPIIYGEDNRWDTEFYPVKMFRDKALSVAGMVSTRKLVPDSTDDNYYKFFKKSASRQYGVCKSERFSEQIVLPVCTGFLVAPDILVTAGHCVESQNICDNFSWVFDYVEGTERIEKKNVYKCKAILSQKLKSTYITFKDYAVIQLDRETNRAPLSFRKKGRPNWGEKLVVIGHPTGMPQKIADGAEVKIGSAINLITPLRTAFRKRDFFFANLDTFQGNSGSPVFNEETGLVEGILTEGAADYTQDPEQLCDRSVVRSNSGLVTDEKVFRITKVKELEELMK